MSFFQYTAREVEEARERGKKDLARVIAAIVADADAKADDPDTYDRGYVMEDLFGRLVAAIAPFVSEPFERWQDHTLAYPEMMVRDQAGLVRPFVAHVTEEAVATFLAEDAEAAVREVLRKKHEQTWCGEQRHEFEAGYSGYSCVRMVERRSGADQCGYPSLHMIHHVAPVPGEKHEFATSPGMATCGVQVWHEYTARYVPCGHRMNSEVHE
jgi:hypothetical protein